jgi:hypothetical protein
MPASRNPKSIVKSVPKSSPIRSHRLDWRAGSMNYPPLDFQLLLTWSQGFQEQLDPGQCYRWFAANDVACHLTQNGHPKSKWPGSQLS